MLHDVLSAHFDPRTSDSCAINMNVSNHCSTRGRRVEELWSFDFFSVLRYNMPLRFEMTSNELTILIMITERGNWKLKLAGLRSYTPA